MLKVTLHHATQDSVSAQNILGRLDIGYARLDATADYKAVMQTSGLGEQSPVTLTGYPRWSASIWDLVARITCLGINRREAIWPAEIPVQRRCAFIENMTALVEHWPDGVHTRRASVGSARVSMLRRKGRYEATFTDDILGEQRSEVFTHTPEALNAWDLLVRAYAWTVAETFVLPPRPQLYVPIPVAHGGTSYVGLDTVGEPARSGIRRWMSRRGIPPVSVDLLAGECVTEAHFVEFLQRAV